MHAVGSILLTWLTTLAISSWCGWGLTVALLPASLRRYRPLLIPLVGYTVVIWLGYNAVHSFFNLRQAVVGMAIIATVVNVVVLARARTHGPRRFLDPHAWHWLSHPLPFVLALALIVGVLPLLHYGYAALIGGGWDGESYLALSQHLQDYSLAHIPTAPTSPLRDHVVDPARIGLSLGHSVVHGTVQILSRRTALATFAPLQALMRTLGLLAFYIWFRSVMGLRRAAALWAIALAAAGPLLLWVAYFNFGMQLAAWPLIPLSLLTSVAAVEAVAEHGWRHWFVLLLPALVWSTMAMTYYPALTVAVPVAAGLVVALLLSPRAVEQRSPWSARLALLLPMVAIAILTLLLSTWVIGDYLGGFRYRYANTLTTLGLFRFIPLSDILGWTTFHLRDAPATVPPAMVIVAMATSALLAVAALIWSPRRGRWLAVLIGAALYLIWVRYGRVYHYAFMKGGAYVGVIAAGLLAAGAQALWDRLRPLSRPIVAVPLLLLLALAVWSQSITVRDHWAKSALVPREVAELDSVAANLLPRTSTVLLEPNPHWNGVTMSIVASALYPRPLWGHFTTGYSGSDEIPVGAQPDYVLRAEDEGPPIIDLPDAHPLWQNGALSLFELPRQGHPSLLLGRDDSVATTANRQTSGILARSWGGAFRLVTPAKPLVVNTAGQLSFDVTRTAPPLARRITLSLATLEKNSLTLNGPGQSETVALDPGAAEITLSVHSPTLEIRSRAPVVVRWIRAVDDQTVGPELGKPEVAPSSDQFVWQSHVSLRGTRVVTEWSVENPARRAVRFELSVVAEQFQNYTPLQRVVAVAPITGTLEMTLQLPQGAPYITRNKTPVPALSVQNETPLPDGSYTGLLSVLDGEARIARVPLWIVNIARGKPVSLIPIPSTIEASPLGPPLSPDARVDVQVGDGVVHMLRGQLAHSTAVPGQTIGTEFLWRAGARPTAPPAISVQILDDTNHKWGQWDGPIGGWYATAPWHPGDTIRQDIPIPLDKAIPPGRYRVWVVCYDPASGTPLPLNDQPGIELQHLVVKP
ncbi:MAG: hypothetical protein NVS2B7_18540 [Herpetosiphon sp.]